MTRKERINSFRNGYFDSLLERGSEQEKTPYSRGMNWALRAYLNTNENGAEEFGIDDMPFMADMDDFMETLEAAGITAFLLWDNSTGLMESLHSLMEHGWEVYGICKTEKPPYPVKMGLRVRRK